MCQECGHQSTVCAGTIFDKTRTPLRVWLSAAWYLTNQKQGVSALGLQRVLGLGSYQTAWTMLHRFRRAMVRQGRQRLKGQVEVDETYLVKNAQRSKTVKVLSSVSVSASPPIGGGFFCWSAAGVHGGLLVNAQGVVLSTRTPLLALIEKASVHPSLRAL
jgi:hypothetical protein